MTLDFDPDVLAYVAESATGPGGGFSSVTQSPGSVTLIHSRLGTSPPLAGDLAASVSFTAVGSGSAAVRTTSVTLVDAAGGDLLLTPTAATTTAVAPAVPAAPAPQPAPQPAPPAPTAGPTSAAPSPPTGSTGSAASTGSPSQAGAATTGATAQSGTSSLARTGVAVGSILLVAGAAIGAGVLLVRRRSAGAR